MLRFRQRSLSVKAYGDDDMDASMSASLRASFQEQIQAPHSASLQTNIKPLPKPGKVSRSLSEPVYPPSAKDPPTRKEPLENPRPYQYVEDNLYTKPSQPSQSQICLPANDRARYQSQTLLGLALQNQEIQNLHESFVPQLSPSIQLVSQGRIRTDDYSPPPLKTQQHQSKPCSNSENARCHVRPTLARKHGRAPLADVSLSSGMFLPEALSRAHKILNDHHNVRQDLSSSKQSGILQSQKLRMPEATSLEPTRLAGRNQNSLPDYGRSYDTHVVKTLPLPLGEEGAVFVGSMDLNTIKMDRQVFIAVTPPRKSLTESDAFRARLAILGVGTEKGIEKMTAGEAALPFHFIAVDEARGSPTSTLSYSLAKDEGKPTGTLGPTLTRVQPATVPGRAVVESPSRRRAVPCTVIAKGAHEPVKIVALDSPSTISSMSSSIRNEPRDHQIFLPLCFLPSLDNLPGDIPGQRCLQRQSVRNCAPTEESHDISRSCTTLNWLPRLGSTQRNPVNKISNGYVSLIEPLSPFKETGFAPHTAALSRLNNSSLASSGSENYLEMGPVALHLEPISRKRTRKTKQNMWPPEPLTMDPTMMGEC